MSVGYEKTLICATSYLRLMLYKILYHPTFNRFSRNLIKSVAPWWKWKSKIPVSGTVKVKTSEGKLYIATNPTSFATKQIFWEGLDNFEYVPIFKKLVQKTSSFIDIGANTGLYSTLGCLCNPNLQVYAFEPSQGPFEYLKKNISINGFEKRIKPYQVALANDTGSADFHEVANLKYKFLDHNLGGVGNLSRKISHRHMTTTKVEVNRLDYMKEELNISGKLLVKIDTEATEDIVLKGMAEVMEEFRPIIICETLYNQIEASIEKIMKGHGYLAYNHIQEQNKLQKVNSIQRKEDNQIRDCFFVSPEDEELLAEFT